MADSFEQYDTDCSARLHALSELPGVRCLCHVMEWSMHGVPWLLALISLLTVAIRQRWHQDNIEWIAAVLAMAILKMCVRRRRPSYNRDDMHASIPLADQFSFPSGHVTRATTFVTMLYGVDGGLKSLRSPSVVYLVILAFSRVVLGRHYLSDVFGGLFIGYLEGLFALYIHIPYRAWYFAARLLLEWQ